MTNAAPDYTTDCRRLVMELRPQSILCIGSPCDAFLSHDCRPEAKCVHLALEELGRLSELGTFDLVFLVSALEHLERSSALHLLARLRDLHGGRLAVIVPADGDPGDTSRWTMEDFLAMGLKLLARYGSDDKERRLYMFDIGTYKETPDWLNPRFWANPERWGKDWW